MTPDRHGFALRLKPERIDEYKRYHREVWAEVLEAIREAGIRNYSIFLKDDLLFGYYEYAGPPDEYAQRLEAMAARLQNVEPVLAVQLRLNRVPEVGLDQGGLLVRVVRVRLEHGLEPGTRRQLVCVGLQVFLRPGRQGRLAPELGDEGAVRCKYLHPLVAPVRDVYIAIGVRDYAGRPVELSVAVAGTAVLGDEPTFGCELLDAIVTPVGLPDEAVGVD